MPSPSQPRLASFRIRPEHHAHVLALLQQLAEGARATLATRVEIVTFLLLWRATTRNVTPEQHAAFRRCVTTEGMHSILSARPGAVNPAAAVHFHFAHWVYAGRRPAPAVLVRLRRDLDAFWLGAHRRIGAGGRWSFDLACLVCDAFGAALMLRSMTVPGARGAPLLAHSRSVVRDMLAEWRALYEDPPESARARSRVESFAAHWSLRATVWGLRRPVSDGMMSPESAFSDGIRRPRPNAAAMVIDWAVAKPQADGSVGPTAAYTTAVLEQPRPPSDPLLACWLLYTARVRIHHRHQPPGDDNWVAFAMNAGQYRRMQGGPSLFG